MRHKLFVTLVLLWMVGACSGMGHGGGTANGSTERAAVSSNGAFRVTYAPTPDPIPFNEIFSLQLTAQDAASSTALSGATLAVDAWMPAHNHGMTTQPSTVAGANGAFTTTGMQFHMSGAWEIRVDVTHNGTTDRALFAVECCGD